MRTDTLNLKIKKIMGSRTKKYIIKALHPFRNSFILLNVSDRAKNNKVNLNYWNESKNIGDSLAPAIVNYLLSIRGLDINKNVSQRKHLYTIGSILTSGIQDATVWGSGVLDAKLLYRLENRTLDIRAVRGPVTRMLLCDYGYYVPEIYGDPAILMPEIYTPSSTVKTHKFGLITHMDYNLSKAIKNKETLNDIKQINVKTSNYEDFIDQVVSVETIISSSLHGIILAESYGVNAILLMPQTAFTKYYDYYYSTNRLNFAIASSVEDAVNTAPSMLPSNIDILRNNLKAAFPYDLYI